MVQNAVIRCAEIELEANLRMASNEGFKLVSAVEASGLYDRFFFLFFVKEDETTNIREVNISVNSNQDPNRIAKKTAQILCDLGKRPKLKKGDKVEMTGWFDTPIVVTVDEVYRNGDGFVGSNEMGNFHVPYAADHIKLKKVS